MTYEEFLKSKEIAAQQKGLAKIPRLAKHLFDYQKHSVEFGLRAGSWGCFLDTGLGKTLCELEWCKHAAEATNGYALILTPLAVARQIEAEGNKFGYNIRVIRDQSEAKEGINVCNYDRLGKLQPDSFGAVALDESSIIKSFNGKTTLSLINAFSGHRFRMGATATPAPNDHMELGQHSEFLGVMPTNEMLIRWFLHDASNTATWRLKGHAVNAFYDWMASWSRMAEHPKDLGDDVSGFDLPTLSVHRHFTESDVAPTGSLFADSVSATDMFRVKALTAKTRAEMAAKIAGDMKGPVIIWCDSNTEADALLRAFDLVDGVVEVRGSQDIDEKEEKIHAFTNQEARIIISKPSICGHGLNWQHCSDMVFVGRTFSYESYYQAVRRCWRFGQKKPVNVHLIVTDAEESITRTVDRKADEHKKMKAAMVAAMRRAMEKESNVKVKYNPNYGGRLPSWFQFDKRRAI